MNKYQKSIGREQAIKLSKTKWWEGKSSREIAEFQLFTAELCCPFDVFHAAIEESLGRSVWTHEFATEQLFLEFLGRARAPTMEEIINLVPDAQKNSMPNPRVSLNKVPKVGQLRIWWIPQVPMESFFQEVKTVHEAKLLLDTLAKYDLFQLEHKVKSDYSNAGGLTTWDGLEWVDWEDTDGNSIDDLMDEDVDATGTADDDLLVPRCRCGKPCQWYGVVGGFSKSCTDCNAHKAKQSKESRARKG